MKPDSAPASPNNSRWSVFLRKAKRIMYLTGLVIVFILAIYGYWKYFYTYSEGNRVGLLQKFSHKGTIFKTYEGELILSSVKGSSNVVIASEKFFFSVKNDSVAAQLDTLQGNMVTVHYKQKNAPLFWRGDSPYLVDGVKSK
jgi:hypothetical protein